MQVQKVCEAGNTVDLEKKYFCGLGHLRNFFTIHSQVNDLERDYTRQETWSMNSLLHSCLHAAVSELLACKRVPRNALDRYCGSKDGRLLEKIVTCLPCVT